MWIFGANVVLSLFNSLRWSILQSWCQSCALRTATFWTGASQASPAVTKAGECLPAVLHIQLVKQSINLYRTLLKPQTWGRVHFNEYEYEYGYIGDWRVRVWVHLWWMSTSTSTSTFYTSTSTSTFPWIFSRMMTYTIIQAITRTNSHTSIVAYTYPVCACMHSYIIMSYDDIAQFFQTC